MSSIVQTQTTSFKAELYEGIHDLLTDEIKIAPLHGGSQSQRNNHKRIPQTTR